MCFFIEDSFLLCNNLYNVFIKENNMNVISYSAFRAELATTLDQVVADHSPVMITRQNGKHAVVMSLEDFAAYEETAYLLRSPKNRERLLASIDQLNSGKIIERELQE
ncbi:type II toxin-antitoxin system prevent-host-death family antitoxin [Aggregatibacter actinomycetemcomitans]|nr:type II toxin-antitoxin system prevent-host-death family antitoxin [Aggregatibacter actinomycetemcomitans]TYA26085.1 type II toxin-antitoxin system prevent-host-death family antitoxin [Aggregatibacter actinomycetemcomitans]TYA31175.1 type II toxin-antitoxin system prevent-host-death family antitoxin [Aggregatibacter actinomycetemcomitans]TYA33840.1 type II toxin-antitoxin system prevent-host-death family antitoxin [Aggregatibacter actinomycetemcomitans]TYA90123.1 type II toxin-antitoxin syst